MSPTHLFTTLALLSSIAFASPAAAQRETFSGHDVALALEDADRDEVPEANVDLTLRPPSAGDYALPVTGIVLGSLMTLGGAVVALGSGMVMAIQAGFDRDTSGTELVVGLSAAGAAVGLTLLVAGATSVADLRRRERRADRVVPALSVAPIDSGAMIWVGGAY